MVRRRKNLIMSRRSAAQRLLKESARKRAFSKGWRRCNETSAIKLFVCWPKLRCWRRVMLAEFYQTMGLRRLAQGEVERALAVDPQNEAARALLTSLKNKS